MRACVDDARTHGSNQRRVRECTDVPYAMHGMAPWHRHLIHRLQRGGVRTTYYCFTGGTRARRIRQRQSLCINHHSPERERTGRDWTWTTAGRLTPAVRGRIYGAHAPFCGQGTAAVRGQARGGGARIGSHQSNRRPGPPVHPDAAVLPACAAHMGTWSDDPA